MSESESLSFNARVLRIIAEIEAEGPCNLSDIARKLNDRGIPTARGAKWRGGQVGRMLVGRKPGLYRRR